MKLERNREQWEKCDPEAMSKMSQSAIYFALKDAKHDILALHAELLARAALTAEKVAQAEPVGWAWRPRGGSLDFSDAQDKPSELDFQHAKATGGEFVPLYAAPPAQTVQSGEPSYAPYGWVGKGNYWTQMESEAAKHHPMTLVYVPTNASPQPAQTERALTVQLNAAYAALDVVTDWAKQEGADDDMEAGARLLALLLKHGVHPRETTAAQRASGDKS